MSALVKYETDTGIVELSPSIIKNYLVSGDPSKVTGQEIMMFLMLCKHQKLNPFLREAYLIKYGNDKATIVTGKEVFTKRAALSGKCTGWEAGIIVENNGKLDNREGTFMLENENLVGGWAKVHLKDYVVPISSTVSLAEYMRFKRDGTPMANWKSMPATMIRKVALVQALREAFPEDFQGLYSAEEMPVEMASLDEKPVQAKQEAPQEHVEGEEAIDVESSPATFDDAQEMLGGTEVDNETAQPAQPAQPAKKSNDTRVISEAQYKRMFAIAKGNKDLIDSVVTEAGFEKGNQVTRDLYEDVCNEIEYRLNNPEPAGVGSSAVTSEDVPF